MKGEEPVMPERAAERPKWVSSWKLWTLPGRVVGYVLGTEVAALVLAGVLAASQPAKGHDYVRFALLLGLGLLAAESTRRVEQLRRQLSDTPHVNMSSVWILAVTLLTTPSLGAAAAVVLYAHFWWRTWRYIASVPAYRAVFNAAMMALSAFAADAVAHWFPANDVLDITKPEHLIAPVLVIGVFWLVNSVLVAVVIWLSQGEAGWSRLLGCWSDNALEVSTLCMGVLTASLVAWRPWMVVLVLPPLYVLHRSVLIKQLEHAATTDRKTGLLNATSWHSLADRELAKAARHSSPSAVLMIDLDHFKRVNDTYGHLVGDEVLRKVADTIRQQVRRHDLCGRFGGEEFVVFMPDTGRDDAVRIAERLRAAVHAIPADEKMPRVSVSIGVGTYPELGHNLEDVLLAADNALFGAKNQGRDRVVSEAAAR
ncbi:GGDEF domain-containing protein [Amycolatopsis magusensis]